MDTEVAVGELEVPKFPALIKILTDDPTFQRSLDKPEREAHRVQEHVNAIASGIRAYCDAAKAFNNATKELAMAFQEAAPTFAISNSDLDNPMEKIGAALLGVCEACTPCIFETETAVEPALSEMQDRMTSLWSSKEQTHDAFNKYLNTMHRFCQTSAGSEDMASEEFHRRSHKACAARLKARQTALDYLSDLQSTLSVKKLDVLHHSLDFTLKQERAFKAMAEHMNNVEPFVNIFLESLGHLRMRTEADQALEKVKIDAHKLHVVDEYQKDVGMIPEEYEKSSAIASTLKRIGKSVVGRQAGSIPTRKQSSPRSHRRRLRSRKEKDRGELDLAMPVMTDSLDAEHLVEATQSLLESLESQPKQGFMFRRHKDKKWHLEHFAIRGGNLVCLDQYGTGVVVAQLLLSTVRQVRNSAASDRNGTDRHNCFEVITPSDSVMLQALGPREMTEWIEALTAAIAAALETGKTSRKGDNLVQEGVATTLATVRGNDRCADCGSTDTEWASISLGILLCIGCSGAHRHLGVHISKVRSTTLDRWSKVTVDYMLSVGNAKSNARYEAKLSQMSGVSKPGPDARETERQKFIVAKYRDRAFADMTVPVPSPPEATETLSNGTSQASLPSDSTVTDRRSRSRNLSATSDDVDLDGAPRLARREACRKKSGHRSSRSSTFSTSSNPASPNFATVGRAFDFPDVIREVDEQKAGSQSTGVSEARPQSADAATSRKHHDDIDDFETAVSREHHDDTHDFDINDILAMSNDAAESARRVVESIFSRGASAEKALANDIKPLPDRDSCIDKADSGSLPSPAVSDVSAAPSSVFSAAPASTATSTAETVMAGTGAASVVLSKPPRKVPLRKQGKSVKAMTKRFLQSASENSSCTSLDSTGDEYAQRRQQRGASPVHLVTSTASEPAVPTRARQPREGSPTLSLSDFIGQKGTKHVPLSPGSEETPHEAGSRRSSVAGRSRRRGVFASVNDALRSVRGRSHERRSADGILTSSSSDMASINATPGRRPSNAVYLDKEHSHSKSFVRKYKRPSVDSILGRDTAV